MKKILDIFAGAGGLSCGLEMVGFKSVGAIEWDADAARTFKKNHPKAKVISKDISKISNNEILKNFKNIDIVVGGPPCQGFSNGNRCSFKDDPRNELFFEFIRIVKILKPPVFIMENVPGLLTRNDGFAKNKIIEIMKKLGYKVSVDILLASNYGVPQKRKRAFFIGQLKNKFDFSKIEKKMTVSVGDAIKSIENLTEGDKLPKPSNKYESFLTKKQKILLNHKPSKHSKIVIDRISHIKPGENWKSVPESLWEKQRNNRHSSAYRRLEYEKPSITIDTGHMNYFHPKLNRTPTVRESARIQSFPDSFIFTGSVQNQLKQVGNAVPPLLAKVIGERIKEENEWK